MCTRVWALLWSTVQIVLRTYDTYYVGDSSVVCMNVYPLFYSISFSLEQELVTTRGLIPKFMQDHVRNVLKKEQIMLEYWFLKRTFVDFPVMGFALKSTTSIQ